MIDYPLRGEEEGGPEWTFEDSVAAHVEGWDIFECWGSLNGPWQIQKFDDEDRYAEDNEVWSLVRQRAAAGSALHQKALDFLQVHNPREYEAVTTWEQEEVAR